MSGNQFSDYAGVQDQSRVRKPPGGDTNNIFDLESRQKWQASQTYPEKSEMEIQEKDDHRFKVMPSQYVGDAGESRDQDPRSRNRSNNFDFEGSERFQERRQCNQQIRPQGDADKFGSFNQESGYMIRNIEHDIPSRNAVGYAGVTDKTRVRKPPGGDTHDIFNMESRQRSQAMEKQFNLNRFVTLQANTGSLNPQDQRNVDQLKCLQLDSNESPFFQLDKENINLLSGAEMAEGAILKKNALEDEEDEKLPTKKYLLRNPITGEVSEMKVAACSKLSDCSNVVVSTSDLGQVVKGSEANRTSVRVRQPPGGVSSYIF